MTATELLTAQRTVNRIADQLDALIASGPFPEEIQDYLDIAAENLGYTVHALTGAAILADDEQANLRERVRQAVSAYEETGADYSYLDDEEQA